MMRLFAILFILISGFYSSGCESESEMQFQADASQFCAVFSPDVWIEMKKSLQGAKLMDEFLRRIDDSVRTKEFENIMDRQNEQVKDADVLYQFYVKEVTELTGTKFSCPDLKIYFEQTLM